MLVRNKIRIIFVCLLFLFASAGAVPSIADQRSQIVVSDNELATQAGMEILKRGGNAVDAAVATAFALGVVDPASSGMGGGGFMVIYQTKERKAHALDFRETAPAAADNDLYIKNGRAVPSLSVDGPLAVAVPGQVAGLTEALKRFGSLPLPAVMAPAIRYATEGFPAHPHLRRALERQIPYVRKSPDLSRIFLREDQIPPEGEKIRQPELSEALRAVAEQGAKVFYEGWIAQAITDVLKKNGGILALEDLKNYKPVWREPLLGSYRNRLIITMPPPSSGGVALLQMLQVLEEYHLGLIPHNSPTYLHLLAETMKHVFSDRAKYLGDPAFVQIPMEKLTSKGYAIWIRSRISPAKTYPSSFYGLTAFQSERGGTTHFGVLDRFGNAVSCSLSINTRFGSKVFVPGAGVILNNHMDDFSIQPGVANVYGLVGNKANSIQPNKRPLSSMTPTIILEGERPALIVGASGGPRIISATLQTILNILDFHMPLKTAIISPRIHHQWLPDELMVESEIPPDTRTSLGRRGHRIQEKKSLAVVQAIRIRKSKVTGEADPRKQE